MSKRDWWLGVVSLATALVILGLIGEAPELYHDAISIYRKLRASFMSLFLKKLPKAGPKSEAPDWVKAVALIGWIFIVVGVSGEEYAGIKVKHLDANIQNCSDAKVREATIEAGDAGTSAKTAHDEADAVSKEADAIQKRLKVASEQLNALESDVLIQGPRWNIIKVRRGELVGALKPFAGQKITIQFCGSLLSAQSETYETWHVLWMILSDKTSSGPGWDVKVADWFSCPPNGPMFSGGNLVVTSSDAKQRVKEAAHALSDALNKIGVITNKQEMRASDVRPDTFKSPLFFGRGSPWELAATDPTSVILFVGPAATAATVGQKPRHK